MVRTGRGRDFIPHATERWECRRSRSPFRLGGQEMDELLVTSSQEPPTSGRFDPMTLEATVPPPTQSPHLCFYPDNSGEAPLSPEYAPTSLLGAGSLQEVKFGPGVQLGDDQPVYRATTHPPVEEIRDIEIADLVHRMEIDTEGGMRWMRKVWMELLLLLMAGACSKSSPALCCLHRRLLLSRSHPTGADPGRRWHPLAAASVLRPSHHRYLYHSAPSLS